MAKQGSNKEEKSPENTAPSAVSTAPDAANLPPPSAEVPLKNAGSGLAPATVAEVEQGGPAFKVVMRANGMDMESINGQLVYFVGAHNLLRTPPDWADKLGLEPVWHPIGLPDCSISPTTFKDAKGQVHPAYFMKTKTEIQLWMERK